MTSKKQLIFLGLKSEDIFCKKKKTITNKNSNSFMYELCFLGWLKMLFLIKNWKMGMWNVNTKPTSLVKIDKAAHFFNQKEGKTALFFGKCKTAHLYNL